MKRRSRRSIVLLKKTYDVPENLLEHVYPETEVDVSIPSTRGHLVLIKIKGK